MKVFIVTKACKERFKCLPVIRKYNLEPTFLCDTVSQKRDLIELGVHSKNIVVRSLHEKIIPGIQGVARARHFVVNHLMPKNEWSFWLDDNVEAITGLSYLDSVDKIDFRDGTDWVEEFSKPLSEKDFNLYMREMIRKAEEVGTIFCGFSTESNCWMRVVKWQKYGYCRTQFALYKNDGSSWFPFPTMMWEDGYKSIDVVARYGQILINRHVKPKKKQFEAGGIGSFEERLPHLRDNCQRILELYPGLVKYPERGVKYKTDTPQDFRLIFAKIKRRTVDIWRKENGYA